MMLQRGTIVLQINKSRYIGFIGVVLAQLMFMSNAQSEIFKCTNSKGGVYYNDKHCPVKDKEQELKAVKDVANGYTPPVLTTNKAPLRANKKVENSNQSDNRKRKGIATNKRTLDDVKNMQAENKTSSSSKNLNTPQAQVASINKRGESSESGAIDKKGLLSLEEQEQLFIEIHAGEVSEPRLQ